MVRKTILLFIVFIYTLNLSYAFEGKLDCSQNLTISDGLAHNGVTSLLEDSRGYLWVGTYDGISRYDGYEFVTFKNTIHKELLVSNRVRSLAEDRNGDIWIGTDQGVSLYNHKTERFQTVYSSSNYDSNKKGPIVRKIIPAANNKHIFCLTEGEGIFIFNKQHKLEEHIVPENTYGISDFTFFDGIEIDSTHYIFSTSVGLLSYNLLAKEFSLEVKHTPGVSNASLIKKGNFIFASRRDGISIVMVQRYLKDYTYNFRGVKFEDYQIRSVSIDRNNNLWMGTLYDGLLYVENVKELVKGRKVDCKIFNQGEHALRTSSIVTDTKSGSWVTTFNRGIYRFENRVNPFKQYIPKENEKLRSKRLSHMAPYGKDRVLLSATREKLKMYNTRTEEYEPLPFDLPKDFGDVGFVFVDSAKDIWIRSGTKNVFCRVRYGTSKVELIDSKFSSVLNNVRPRTTTEDKFGSIWIGDEDDVYRISLNSNREIENIQELNLHPYFEKDQLALVRCVYADPLKDFIWVGTDSDGLIRINNQKKAPLNDLVIDRFLRNKKNTHSISSNFVSCIVRLPNDELWIGTERGGICKVLNEDRVPEFITFTEKNGLSNNVVKQIFYDNEYNIWVATNIGLNKFFTKDNHFRSFSKADGLPFEDFWYTTIRLDNGYVVSSGMDNFCYFRPEKISDKEPLPSFGFENLRIGNELVSPLDTIGGRVILEERINDLDKIVLNYDENVFSLELNALHFSNTDNHFLRYQLLPVSTEWMEVSSDQKVISYSGLNPGEYTFRAMASNSLHEWTAPKELSIVIEPPYWRTWQAYLLYFLLVTLLFYIWAHYTLKFQSLKHNLEIEQLEKSKVQDVNQAKLRFFANISHEIKTPLTLISGPVSILSDRFRSNDDVQKKLQIVQRQSRKISQLIEQVHDFQRSDAGHLDMNITQFCFDDFVQEIKSDFDFMASSDKKHLKIVEPKDRVYVSADRDKLEKIFNNLLNNAFKYTQKDDTIGISYHVQDNDLIVTVRDSGKGIASDDLPFIFERFYQSKHKHSQYTGGSGIGLAFSKRLVEMHYGDIDVKSTLGEGSVFELRLPVTIDGATIEFELQREDLIKLESQEVVHNSVLEFNISSVNVDSKLSNSVVFLAEDNTEMRNFVSGVLSNFFTVKSFENGQKCLDAMQEEWPDIIISDVLMPEMNGFDLCKNIKADIKTSHIPVILLTACTAVDDQIQGLELGADAYIKKPFNMQHLVTRTESLLRNRIQLRERYNIDLPLKKHKEDNSANDNAFLEKLYQLMERNLDNQEVDLDRFAKELYLNRTHFFQKVKVVTNQTPYELLKSYRIKKSAEFLVQQELSVNEVFMMTGFKSRAHFNKLFKEKYNTTPGRYASEMQKQYSEPIL